MTSDKSFMAFSILLTTNSVKLELPMFAASLRLMAISGSRTYPISKVISSVNVFLKLKNIGKLVLHKVVRLIGAEIWPFQFPVAAILDFLHNGHQGSPPTCMRWFLKMLYPYLTSCKVLKSCHKVHDFYKYWHIPSPL